MDQSSGGRAVVTGRLRGAAAGGGDRAVGRRPTTQRVGSAPFLVLSGATGLGVLNVRSLVARLPSKSANAARLEPVALTGTSSVRRLRSRPRRRRTAPARLGEGCRRRIAPEARRRAIAAAGVRPIAADRVDAARSSRPANVRNRAALSTCTQSAPWWSRCLQREECCLSSFCAVGLNGAIERAHAASSVAHLDALMRGPIVSCTKVRNSTTAVSSSATACCPRSRGDRARDCGSRQRSRERCRCPAQNGMEKRPVESDAPRTRRACRAGDRLDERALATRAVRLPVEHRPRTTRPSGMRGPVENTIDDRASWSRCRAGRPVRGAA